MIEIPNNNSDSIKITRFPFIGDAETDERSTNPKHILKINKEIQKQISKLIKSL